MMAISKLFYIIIIMSIIDSFDAQMVLHFRAFCIDAPFDTWFVYEMIMNE